MRLLSIDPKQTRVVVQPASSQDLWKLSEVIEPGDKATAKTERKIKVGEDAVARKTLTLSIIVERVEIAGDLVRIMGITAEGTDDVPKGSHHTLTITSNDTLTIEKDWAGWQLEKLREDDSPLILVLLLDREEALFALLRRDPEVLSNMKGAVPKKGIDGGSPLWSELAKQLAEYNERYKPRHIVIASPAFFKEYVLELLTPELLQKTVSATISATGASALAELVKRPELKQVLQKERFSNETIFVERVLDAIHQEKASWGVKEVSEMANAGSLELVIVSARLLKQLRERGEYEQVKQAMQIAEKTKAEVHVLDTSAAQRLDTLGGIAGVRRW